MKDDLNEVKITNSKLSSDRSTEKLLEVKKKFEQMSNTIWKDYSNPGPIETNIYIPSLKYLKWEDLEFASEHKTLKVKMGESRYKIEYFKYVSGFVRFYIAEDKVITLSETRKQFFNDLHLKVVEEDERN